MYNIIYYTYTLWSVNFVYVYIGHHSLLQLQEPKPFLFSHKESVAGTEGLGVLRSSDYNIVIENYRQLFW